jgi:hypothetical protein
VRPDLFPLQMLTSLETQLWAMFFEQRERGRKKGAGKHP